jgi:5'-3' exonuclease
VDVYLLDGTYELFRQHYGQAVRGGAGSGGTGATRGVLRDVVAMLAGGTTHLGVATDHVIESFRNDLWPTYKSSAGVPAELLDQFTLLEVCLEALGVWVWPMVELEADDALASAAAVCADQPEVQRVLVCTPDKDLAQCVVGERVVQVDRRSGEVRSEKGVWEKFGVAPSSIPDWLALVGDSSDGFPGLSGWGKTSASVALAHYGHIQEIPDDVSKWEPSVVRRLRGAGRLASSLAADRGLALLFKDLATLRVDRSLLASAADLEWRGPTEVFDEVCEQLGDSALAERARALSDHPRG